MTDIKLLPLPELPVAVERFIVSSLGPMKREGAVTALRTMLREYARANVAHATAAKDAEIEALRAEVRERDASLGWWGRFASGAVNARKDAEARAERMAEALQRALDAVRDTLQDAYQNAGQECCGRGGMHDCCGEPEPVWTPEDQAVMDKLGPIERLLSSALRDHHQEGKGVSR